MSDRRIVGDVVSTWMKHAVGRRTVLFAPTKDCSKLYCEQFVSAGIAAAHVDDGTSAKDREGVWRRLELSAPTKHDALWLDHVGNCRELDGTPSDIESWSLEDGKPRRVSEDDPSLARKHCAKCFRHFYRTVQCPECGSLVERTIREVKIRAGELVEFERQKKAQTEADARHRYAFGSQSEPLRQKYQELKRIAQEKGYKAGWVGMRFHQQFGKWPTKAWNNA